MFLIIFTFLLSNAYAFELKCPTPIDLQNVLDCLKENHRSIIEQKSLVELDRMSVAVAGQILNPELDVQTVYGPGGTKQTQISLVQDANLGGKISKRRKIADARANIRNQEYFLTKEATVRAVILKFYELYHLEETFRINQEIYETYEKLIKSYRSRPALSPDQESSLAIFEIMDGEIITQLALLEDEIKNQSLFFAINGGYEYSVIKKLLVNFNHDAFLNYSTSTESHSLDVNKLQFELNLAQHEYDLAKANTWGDVRIGPMYQIENFGNGTEQMYGFQLLAPIPLFNLNGPQREVAKYGVERAKYLISIKKNQESIQFEQTLERYQNLAKVYKKLPLENKIRKNHSKVAALFKAGVVPSTQLIESHRQWRDYLFSRHNFELRIIENYLEIMKLKNSLVTLTI